MDGFQNGFSINRFDRVHIEDADSHAVGFKFSGGLECLEYAGSASDDRRIRSFIDFDGFADLISVVVRSVDNLVEAAVNADIDGAVVFDSGANDVGRFHAVGRHNNNEIG
jgi:hypothetical protein